MWQRTCQMPVEQEIRQSWISHTLRKPVDSITQQALPWNPEGKRKRERPKHMVPRSESRRQSLERMAQDRSGWRSHVGGLTPEGAKALID